MAKKPNLDQVARYADMLSAMGTEPRLRIVRLLLSAHPDGMVVGDVGAELDIPNSTLSHHLDKLKNEGLVNVRREGTFLRYSANAPALQPAYDAITEGRDMTELKAAEALLDELG